MWPTLTQGEQSSWEDHQITGENIRWSDNRSPALTRSAHSIASACSPLRQGRTDGQTDTSLASILISRYIQFMKSILCMILSACNNHTKFELNQIRTWRQNTTFSFAFSGTPLTLILGHWNWCMHASVLAQWRSSSSKVCKILLIAFRKSQH